MRLNDLIRIAEAEGSRCFIEKTPKHIHAFSRICKVVPNAKFVALTRNPLDNCASLYKRFGDLDYAIKRYEIDNAAVLRLLSFTKKSSLVRYEDLVASPEKTLRGVADFIGLDWDDAVLEAGPTAYDKFNQGGNMDVRKNQVSQPIISRSGSWKKLLREEEKERVQKELRGIAYKLGYEWSLDE